MDKDTELTLQMPQPLHDYKPDTTLLWLIDAKGNTEFLSPSWQIFTGHPLETLMKDGWYTART